MPSTTQASGAMLSDASRMTRLDANTEQKPNKSFELKRIFYPIQEGIEAPHVRQYRLSLFQETGINDNSCSLDDAFFMSNTLPSDLSALSPGPTRLDKNTYQTSQESGDATCFYGKESLTVGSDWQPIASLSPHEVMTHYHTEPNHALIQIQYSNRDNLYYIRSTSGKKQTIKLDFLVKVPHKHLPLKPEIKELVKKYQKFSAGALTLSHSNPTGKDYLKALQTQKKGACRHRAFAFKMEMAEFFPDTPVRIVTNGCHAFVEIKTDGGWISCDLGGYPANLTIQDENNPKTEKNTSPIHAHSAPKEAKPIKAALYESYFETWDKSTSSTGTLIKYSQHCISFDANKRLIECESTQQTDSVIRGLETYCKATHQPVFVIHSPKDLVCGAGFVKPSNDNPLLGEVHKGPGGPLYDFLQAHREGQKPILLVNYEQFEADDIVRFNELLDPNPRADGTALPKDTLIIGVTNLNKPDCYQGSDFYSRFKITERCPVSPEQCEYESPTPPPPATMTMTEVVSQAPIVIDLYHTADWERRLLGGWTLDIVAGESQLVFEPGLLQDAIAQNLPIHIKNGPWDDKAFVRFWQQLQSSSIRHAGKLIKLEDGNVLSQSEGYDWQTLSSAITMATEKPDATCPLLNPGLLHNYFRHYDYDDKQQALVRVTGLIEKASQNDPKTLTVLLTRTVDEDEWANLLNACQQFGCTIVLC